MSFQQHRARRVPLSLHSLKKGLEQFMDQKKRDNPNYKQQFSYQRLMSQSPSMDRESKMHRRNMAQNSARDGKEYVEEYYGGVCLYEYLVLNNQLDEYFTLIEEMLRRLHSKIQHGEIFTDIEKNGLNNFIYLLKTFKIKIKEIHFSNGITNTSMAQMRINPNIIRINHLLDEINKLLILNQRRYRLQTGN
jgi:hypothetical protein